MNVQFCLDAVLSHPPFDQEEAASKTATLAFLRTHDRFWQRDNYAGHLTVSAWVVNPALSHVLLTHHKKLGRWLQLGGHIEAGDGSMLAGALREAQEESGIQAIEPLQTDIFDIDHHPIPAAKEPAHVHYDVRYLLVAKEMDFIVSEESHDLAWFALQNLPEINHSPDLVRMVRKLN